CLPLALYPSWFLQCVPYRTAASSCAQAPLSLPLHRRRPAQLSRLRISGQELWSIRLAMVMMGQLGRLVDGIKSRLRSSGGSKQRPGGGGSSGRRSKAYYAASSSSAGYDKVEKTESMRVEIRSRQARKLIAKNLDAADAIGRAAAGRGANKRFFLAF
ncbi:hypothetical protein U9M48_039000, partial [Paspalum notatum var. saurae]